MIHEILFVDFLLNIFRVDILVFDTDICKKSDLI